MRNVQNHQKKIRKLLPNFLQMLHISTLQLIDFNFIPQRDNLKNKRDYTALFVIMCHISYLNI